MTAALQPTLDLPGIDITPTGAATDLATPEAITAGLAACARIGATWRWVVGDLVLALGGGNYAEVPWVDVAELNIDSRASLARSVAVAYRVAPERRRAALSWGHHEAVAYLDGEGQELWLGRAEANGWTIGQLTDAILDDGDEGDEVVDDEPPALLPRLKRSVIGAVEDLWAHDPGAAVVIRSDGTWRVMG